MGKYKREVTEYVLDRISILDVVGQSIELKRAGRNHKGLCPFHGEKTPSFIVSEERNNFHCFGCGVSGNAIGFVMQKENMGFLDALEYIADRFNLDLEPFLEKENAKKESDTKPLYEIMRQAALFFYHSLGQYPDAKGYLTDRGLSPSILKQFGLGFAPQGWDNLLKHLKKQGVSEDMLFQCGLVVKKETGGYYDRFRNRVMFPIFDHRSRVVAFGGRVLDDSVPKYLNSAESRIFYKSQTLYGLNVARKHQDPRRRVIVVEGYMDTITLHQYGFTNTVATLGTAMTELHAKELKKLYDEVIFAYDADEAGQNAIARSLPVLKGVGLRVKVLDMGDAKDPDELIKRHGADKFKEAIEKAMNTIDFSLKRLEKGYNLHDDEQRLVFLKEAYQFIAALESQAERDVYLENLAKRTEISHLALQEDFAVALKSGKLTKELPKPQQRPMEDKGHSEGRAQVEGKSQGEGKALTSGKNRQDANSQHRKNSETDQEDLMMDLGSIDPEDLADLMDSMPLELLDDNFQHEMPPEMENDRALGETSQKDISKKRSEIVPPPLINDPKLVTIEKAVLKCALVSKIFFHRVEQRMYWGFFHASFERDFEAIRHYYGDNDVFDPVMAIETQALDLVERLKDVSVDSTQVTTVGDVDKLLGFHHKHFCEAKIKLIDLELQSLKLKPGQDAALVAREKMVARVALSKELAQAVRELQSNFPQSKGD